jgi:hypothetical protein
MPYQCKQMTLPVVAQAVSLACRIKDSVRAKNTNLSATAAATFSQA